jgi:spore coat protein A, manganese oxidase
MISRRQFIKATAAAGVMAGVGGFLSPRKASAAYYYTPSVIPLFGTKLRGVGPGGIPVAAPGFLPASVTGVTHYHMGILQFNDKGVCPTLGSTTLWGFTPFRGLGGYIKPTHLGGLIVAEKGKPIQITFHNLLFVKKHILPVDTTIPGANQAVNRTAVHLHGGKVPWISDGGPFDWFDPYGRHGLSFLNNKVLNPFALPGAAEYYYPMNESARFLWYHDHAHGITRLNAYAGIASGVLVRDDFERNLMNKGLPDFIENGGREIPIVIQDKTFVGEDIDSVDPGWRSMVQKAATDPGSLWYAHTYDPLRWDVAPGFRTLPDPSVVPEFFGDTMLVNGTVYPEVTVEARRYRIRFLNACNARFLNLQLYVDDGTPNGITLELDPTSRKYGRPKNVPFVDGAQGKSAVLQIGTEGGFLAKPVQIPTNLPVHFDPETFIPMQSSLLMAPAERPDVIIDFSQHEGAKIILYNDAGAPFSGDVGDPLYDYFPGLNEADNPVNKFTKPGFGPNTRVLMRFNVGPATGNTDQALAIGTGTALTAGIDPTLLPTWGHANHTTLPFRRRLLTLNEAVDAYGRLMQTIGGDRALGGAPYESEFEERVAKDDIEVWEIYNQSEDVHPMHFHLVNVQVINRQAFSGIGTFTSRPVAAPPDELGWKETVKMYPGTVTRVIMKFEVPQIVTKKGKVIKTPPSPRTGGNEYVWHCHILEHEEHDMMHAVVVD